MKLFVYREINEDLLVYYLLFIWDFLKHNIYYYI